MLRGLGSLLALFLLIPSPALAAKTLAIKSKPLKAGMTIQQQEKLDFEMEVQVRAGGQVLGSFSGTRAEITNKSEKLLVWTDDHRRVEVTFEDVKHTETSQEPGGPPQSKDEPSVLAGRSFVVDWERGADLTFAQSPGGATATILEAAALADEYEDLADTTNEMTELLAGRKLVIGEAADVPADVIGNLVGDDESFDVEDFSMVLTGKRKVGGRPCAIFSVEIVMSQAESGLRLVIRMAGEVALSIREGWLILMDLEGPLAAEGEMPEEGLTLSGGGTMHGVVTYRYRR